MLLPEIMLQGPVSPKGGQGGSLRRSGPNSPLRRGFREISWPLPIYNWVSQSCARTSSTPSPLNFVRSRRFFLRKTIVKIFFRTLVHGVVSTFEVSRKW